MVFLGHIGHRPCFEFRGLGGDLFLQCDTLVESFLGLVRVRITLEEERLHLRIKARGQRTQNITLINASRPCMLFDLGERTLWHGLRGVLGEMMNDRTGLEHALLALVLLLKRQFLCRSWSTRGVFTQ